MKFNEIKVGQILGATFAGSKRTAPVTGKKYGFKVTGVTPSTFTTAEVKTGAVEVFGTTNDGNLPNWQIVEEAPKK